MSDVRNFRLVNPPAGLADAVFPAMQWSGPKDNPALRSLCDHWVAIYPYPTIDFPPGGTPYVTTEDGGRNVLPGDWIVRFDGKYPRSGVFEVLSGRYWAEAFKPAEVKVVHVLAKREYCKSGHGNTAMAVKWDGDAHTANTFVGDRYGVDWEYLKVGSSEIILNPGGVSECATVGGWIIKYDDGYVAGYTDDGFNRMWDIIEKPANPAIPPFAKTLRGDLPTVASEPTLDTAKKMAKRAVEVVEITTRLLAMHTAGKIDSWEVCRDFGKPGRTFTVKINSERWKEAGCEVAVLADEFPTHHFKQEFPHPKPTPTTAETGFHLAPNAAITVWRDGTWQLWGGMDANYAQTDPDYLVSIRPNELADFQRMEKESAGKQVEFEQTTRPISDVIEQVARINNRFAKMRGDGVITGWEVESQSGSDRRKFTLHTTTTHRPAVFDCTARLKLKYPAHEFYVNVVPVAAEQIIGTAKSADVKLASGRAEADKSSEPIILPRGRSSDHTGPTAKSKIVPPQGGGGTAPPQGKGGSSYKPATELAGIQSARGEKQTVMKDVPATYFDGVWLSRDQFVALTAASGKQPVMEYRVVCGPSDISQPGNLESVVSMLIGCGWQPYGTPMSLGGKQLTQTMVRSQPLAPMFATPRPVVQYHVVSSGHGQEVMTAEVNRLLGLGWELFPNAVASVPGQPMVRRQPSAK